MQEDSPAPRKTPPQRGLASGAARRERQAAALRENLARRKAQARLRRDGPAGEAAAGDETI